MINRKIYRYRKTKRGRGIQREEGGRGHQQIERERKEQKIRALTSYKKEEELNKEGRIRKERETREVLNLNIKGFGKIQRRQIGEEEEKEREERRKKK